MKTLPLGRTGLTVTKTSFGALPIQRCSREDATRILRRAYEGGIRYFDTANAYTDSEEKLGAALHDVRDNIVISTKSGARDPAGIRAHIEQSLRALRTDRIDLFQLHNVCSPEEMDGTYEAALRAKEEGLILHIGATSHSLSYARAMAESGLFETIQFPFSYLSSPEEFALVDLCRERGIGFIAMKALAGGLLANARVVHAFMAEQEGVVPIYGIQTMDELEQWLALAEEEPVLDDAMRAVIAADRETLTGHFCRSCGYCMPCPQGIEIRNIARMDMLLRRSPWQQYFTPEWQEKMERVNDCLHCGQCASRCPYGLDTPALLQYMLKDYHEFYETHKHLL